MKTNFIVRWYGELACERRIRLTVAHKQRRIAVLDVNLQIEAYKVFGRWGETDYCIPNFAQGLRSVSQAVFLQERTGLRSYGIRRTEYPDPSDYYRLGIIWGLKYADPARCVPVSLLTHAGLIPT